MKKVLTRIFVTLGVIFFILIIIGVYFYITDPYNLKPLLLGSKTPVSETSTESTEPKIPETSSGETAQKAASTGFTLSAAQKQALVQLGINPDTVPTTISSAQETCFVSALGQVRVNEIRAGAVPSAIEFIKVKSCL